MVSFSQETLDTVDTLLYLFCAQHLLCVSSNRPLFRAAYFFTYRSDHLRVSRKGFFLKISIFCFGAALLILMGCVFLFHPDLAKYLS